jgi:hypothetical protein
VREALSDSITLFNRRIPLWALGAVVGGLLMVVLLLSAVLSGGGAVPTAADPSATPPPPSPDMAKIFALAAVGNQDAMRTIEDIGEGERSSAAWLALGKGRLATGQSAAAMDAFEKAVAEDTRAGHDDILLRAVRIAVDDDSMRARALRFAATELGAEGADLLFDVWASTSQKTQATVEAKTLLDGPDVRKHASAALSVALALRETKSCSELKALLPAAIESGDERALRPLQKLVAARGCGFLGLGDCYPCLRQGTLLGDAIDAVQIRNAPRF